VTDRVNACLDGELPIEALTAAERLEVERLLGAGAAIRAMLPPAPAGLDTAVLCRIRELGLEPAFADVAEPAMPARTAAPVRSTGLRALLEALWRPRQVSFGLRPAWAGALALVALLLLVREPAPTAVADTAAAAPPVFVQFRLDEAGAQDVVLAGSFSDWAPKHQLAETQPGVWTVIVALEPGVHEYAFLVDGERWVVDPAAPAIEDGFGGHNSRLALLPAL
jgi:hypothetical protein